eukprot:CAMPEP_0172677148 /NCGR_PEP_ID=MMETSP1074-20121228/14475_1 /TAXON_ID=2916 /ORGANISM="Ceratium fusus, Strain PA161109" /LENGTH=127 /DNA_ID=CAMNT_0013494933 /DNA_START=449 /DNA_END=833 /DNA_ORIENTATION=-
MSDCCIDNVSFAHRSAAAPLQNVTTCALRSASGTDSCAFRSVSLHKFSAPIPSAGNTEQPADFASGSATAKSSECDSRVHKASPAACSRAKRRVAHALLVQDFKPRTSGSPGNRTSATEPCSSLVSL